MFNFSLRFIPLLMSDIVNLNKCGVDHDGHIDSGDLFGTIGVYNV